MTIRKDMVLNVAKAMKKYGLYDDVIQVTELLMKSMNEGKEKDSTRPELLDLYERIESKNGVLSQEVRDYVLSTNGVFMRTHCLQELHLTTRPEKKNLTTILARLCEESLIEKTGKKNGEYRLINQAEGKIDFMSASDDNIEIAMPFQIEDWVDIYPKNIIVIAGAPDAGKTAFLLNLAEMNMERHNVYYFSSEMAEQELRLRLSKFKRPLEDFSKCNWIERSGDFHDVIKPDDVNIIDFLEVHEDFWRVGLMIKQIFDKLDKGVAFIALQKDKHKEHGLGGTRGVEKARLYLGMNPGQLTIVKAKNWRKHDFNPNGKILNFRLAQGCYFKYDGMVE